MINNLREFIDIVSVTPIKFSPVPFTIDWGNGRGQGKRSGGTVKGGMGNAPRGVKTYYNYLAGLPDFEKLKKQGEIKRIGKDGLYLKARSFGLNHEVSVIFSHDGYERAYKLWKSGGVTHAR